MIAPDICFFDIETLPTVDPDLIAAIEADITPPGNITKPESIEKWKEEKGSDAKKEAVRRTSLDGGTARLGALAWGWSDRNIVSAHTAVDGAWSIDRERQILRGFFAELDAFRAENKVPPTLVGHNISGFDIRWLWKRSIILGIRPPVWWPVDARPWDANRVQDTMVMWEGAKGRISQDRLARTLGIRGKGAIDGSQVADAWDEGRHEEIRLYCRDDVTCVRQIWCRIAGEDAPEEIDKVVQQAVEVAPVKDKVPVPFGCARVTYAVGVVRYQLVLEDGTVEEQIKGGIVSVEFSDRTAPHRSTETKEQPNKPAGTGGRVIPPFLLDLAGKAA